MVSPPARAPTSWTRPALHVSLSRFGRTLPRRAAEQSAIPPDPVHARAHAAFILEHTSVASTPLVPEIRLHLATEITPLWQATERWLAERGVPPPFWAFSWAGGQALARFVLDRPALVRGRRVLDFASGSGLVAIAAAMAGAADVLAADIDPFAVAAIALNARENQVAVRATLSDLLGSAVTGSDVVLAGDVCYEAPFAARAHAWLRALAASGAEVLLGDPGRAYAPREGVEALARYVVPTPLDLESRPEVSATVWRVKAS